MLAQRAAARCHASRKKLVLADTALFSRQKEPPQEVAEGEKMKDLLRAYGVLKDPVSRSLYDRGFTR